MEERFAFYQPDGGPDTRLMVVYERGGARCELPCRFVASTEHVLTVEVEHNDGRTGALLRRTARRIKASELVSVEALAP